MLSFIGILPVHFLLQSHPTWVRGLKFLQDATTQQLPKSHPTWVRGLKSPLHNHCRSIIIPSHPTWVRGLKYVKQLCLIHQMTVSHPTWVRGLKSKSIKIVMYDMESHPTWVRGLKSVIRHYEQGRS